MANVSSESYEESCVKDVEEDLSDSGLQICLSTPKKKKRSTIEIKPEETKVITEIENDLERNLSEKAAKSNLSKFNVKSILKQVFTNEEVIALVRNADDPKSEVKLTYEPKLTRAKAKELYASHNLTEWIPKSKKVSKTQVLIKEELPEDTSDDEYIPGEESEEEHDVSIYSENDPQTPASVDCGTQTSWSNDGIFKLPNLKPQSNEEANIALRTRSKLSLSDTPLEVIEEAFIPPDITTDMYDLECDDDDWKHFLTQFTRPLDEVAKNLEDEEGDPEYNFLADEEIYKDDKEELRADKGVTVTRKELNQLIAELFDCAENYPLSQQPQITTNKDSEEKIEFKVLNNIPLLLEDQKLLFEQQMRQHVQLLTQSFLMTYDHLEYHDMSNKFKENLVDLKNLVNNQSLKQYKVCNIDSALNIVENWESKFKTNSIEIFEYRKHVIKVLCESRDAKLSGVQYIPTFPEYFLETISKSEVFLYPNLLPRTPFRPASTNRTTSPFTSPEDHLIAIALEQFYPYLMHECQQSKKKVTLKLVCFYINKYCLPVEVPKLYKHIFTSKKCGISNPIKYFFLNNKAPVSMHYVVPLDTFKVLPPCQRDPNQLPAQWKDYLFPAAKIINYQILNPVPKSSYGGTITKVTKPPVYNRTFVKKRKLFPKKSLGESKFYETPKKLSKPQSAKNTSTSKELPFTPTSSRIHLFSSLDLNTSDLLKDNKTSKLNIPNKFLDLKFNSEIFKSISETMLPSMPNLGSPLRCSPEIEEQPKMESASQPADIKSESEVGNNEKASDEGISTIVSKKTDGTKSAVTARTTLKNMKSKQTFSEKKKARLRRDFEAKLRMLSSENKDVMHEKTNRFVQAFYDKLQEQLDIHEYHKFMEVLNDFDEHQDSAINLYDSVANILGDNHPDILDEFLLFFTSHQAKQMKKLIPHQILNNMSLFLRKLELFFKDQPSQVRKIFRALSDLSISSNVTMTQVKSAILPLLKGNPLLIDWFLRVFMCEKPTESLLNDSWENVDVVKDSVSSHDDCYETVTVPEMDDPFGGPNCTCSCHNVEDVSYKSRVLHCVPCGTKYMLGKVFVPSRKGLRLARVSFDDDGVDHSSRLSIQSRTKKSDGSHKQISPSKDSQDGGSSDEEPNKKRKVVKSIKKRPSRKKIDQNKTNNDKIVKKVDVTQVESEGSVHEKSEVTELEYCGSIESLEDKFSPEQPSCESESECCEETSQDNNTDTDGSEEESTNLKNESWTREEDKIILMTFQKEEDEEVAFEKISSVLENRTIIQIRERFQVLINFLKKISSTK